MSMNVQDYGVVREGFPRPFPNTPSNAIEQFKIARKVVVVTGAGDGIGLAVAEGIAEAGGNVIMWYNSNKAAVQRAAKLSQTHSINATTYQVDVSDVDQVITTVSKTINDFGKINVFIANTTISKPILEMTVEEYRKVMSVNANSVLFYAKYTSEVFKQQGFRNLIITSSISAHIINVPTNQPVYNSSKAFITHFRKSLAHKWREFTHINIISPGFFNTKLGASPLAINEAYHISALGRQGHIKEIKGLYLYLASDASTYMTGSDILINRGYILP